MKTAERRSPLQTLACVALAAAVLIVLVERTFRGVDFTDESFHAALTYRFLLGDVPFRDELTVHQTASLLTLPPLWLYDRVIGLPEKLMLFLRLLYVGFSAAVGVLIFRCLRRFVKPLGAVLGAALFMLVYPANDPSYNTLGSGLVAASLCLGVFGAGGSMRWYFPASGLAAGLAVIAYPPLAIWLLFLAAQLWFLLPKNERGRPFRLFVAGAAAVLLPFAALLFAIGPGHVVEAIVRTNETANKLGNVRKILGLGVYFVNRFPVLAVLPLLAALLAISRARVGQARPRLSRIRAPAFLLALLASCFLFLDGGFLRPISGWSNALVSLSLLAPFLIVMLDPGNARRTLFALWLGGAAAGLVMAYFTSSNPGNFAKSGRPCLIALIGAIWIVAQAEATSARRVARGLGLALGSLILVFCAAALYESRRFVYRDRPLEELTHRIPRGPFAGIRTTERRRDLLSSLEEDLEVSVPENAYVIFFDDFPGGFLLSRRRPGTCSVWVFTRPEERRFRSIYVDCTRAMARTPLYAVRIAVDPREPRLPHRAPDAEDSFQRFVERCGGLIRQREGSYEILRLDPLCDRPAESPAPPQAKSSITRCSGCLIGQDPVHVKPVGDVPRATASPWPDRLSASTPPWPAPRSSSLPS